MSGTSGAEVALRRAFISGLERLCSALDNIPTREDGRWYRFGSWGCRWGVARHAAELDEKWGTDVWQPVERP